MTLKVNRVFIDDKHVGYTMFCPGCKFPHAIYIKDALKGGNPVWKFTGTGECPTIRASILVTQNWKEEKRICHSFITKGVWEFLTDCTHDLAGQKVPMLDIDPDDEE